MNDTSNAQDFHDAGKLKARITETHLWVCDRTGYTGAARLEDISSVKEMPLPEGKAAVAARIPGWECSPGVRFADPDEAARFTDALMEAIEAIYTRWEKTVQPDATSELSGDPINVYTRSRAIEDGLLVDVTGMAKRAGIEIHTAITAALYSDISDLSSPLLYEHESLEFRMRDVLVLGRYEALGRSWERFTYSVGIPVGEQRQYTVKAVLAPGDDEAPVLTLMRPDED